MNSAEATPPLGQAAVHATQDPDDGEAQATPEAFPGRCAFWAPERLVESAWLGHIPFAFWSISASRPNVLVELGTHNGASYMAFCQAIDKLGLGTRAYAVDTWLGDPQAGFYDESVFFELTDYHDRRYAAFSRLIRCEFDDALPHFSDGSIDLLHIDGYHTYDAVRHDIEAWKPKLSKRAIVLLHDINVRERDFGAWRLWEELATHYPSFAFHHHHGLGVVCVGDEAPIGLEPLIAAGQDPAKAAAWRTSFATLGRGVQAQWEARHYAAAAALSATRIAGLSEELSAAAASFEAQLSELNAAVSRADRASQEAGRLRSELQVLEQQRDQARAEAAGRQASLEAQLSELNAAVSRADRASQEAGRLRSELQILEQQRDQARSEAAERQASLGARLSELSRAYEISELALAKERRRREKRKLTVFWKANRLFKAMVRPFRRVPRARAGRGCVELSRGLGRHQSGRALTSQSESSSND